MVTISTRKTNFPSRFTVIEIIFHRSRGERSVAPVRVQSLRKVVHDVQRPARPQEPVLRQAACVLVSGVFQEVLPEGERPESHDQESSGRSQRVHDELVCLSGRKGDLDVNKCGCTCLYIYIQC